MILPLHIKSIKHHGNIGYIEVNSCEIGFERGIYNVIRVPKVASLSPLWTFICFDVSTETYVYRRLIKWL